MEEGVGGGSGESGGGRRGGRGGGGGGRVERTKASLMPLGSLQMFLRVSWGPLWASLGPLGGPGCLLERLECFGTSSSGLLEVSCRPLVDLWGVSLLAFWVP
eukprot:5687056-Pyramimonas_sp.AAC.1